MDGRSLARMMKPPLWLLAAFISVGFASLGQVLLKIGVRHGAMPANLARHPLTVLTALWHPYIAAGIVAFAMSMVLWIVALNGEQLSVVYPMAAIGYVIVTIASVWLFGETLNPWKILGIGLIILGVLALNVQAQRASSPSAPLAARPK